MVVIQNIILQGNTISADCFKEGFAFNKTHILVDTEDFSLLNNAERDSYIAHAIWKLKKIYNEYKLGKPIPDRAVSKWY